MCNCMVLDVTAIFFWITAFLKKLPFLAKGLGSGIPLQGVIGNHIKRNECSINNPVDGDRNIGFRHIELPQQHNSRQTV